MLALDAYNRGYNAGIEGLSEATGTQLGSAVTNLFGQNAPGAYLAAAGIATFIAERSIPNTGLTSYDFEKITINVKLHSQNLFVMMLYAKEKYGEDAPDWSEISEPILEQLFDVEIGKAIGLKKTEAADASGAGAVDGTGVADEAAQLLS